MKFATILKTMIEEAKEIRDKCNWCGKALPGEFISAIGKKFCDSDCKDEYKRSRAE